MPAGRAGVMSKPAVGSSSITDSFNRANNASSLGNTDTGQAWSALLGTWGISSNQGYCPSGTSDAIAVVDFGSPDHAVQATIATGAGSGDGLVVRCTDINNLYLAYSDSANAGFYKKVAGTYTQIGSLVGGSWPAPRTLYASMIGTAFLYKVNGSTVISTTDSSLATGNKAGLRAGANTTRFDDLTVA